MTIEIYETCRCGGKIEIEEDVIYASQSQVDNRLRDFHNQHAHCFKQEVSGTIPYGGNMSFDELLGVDRDLIEDQH
jgi:hypothetical protein